MPVRVSSRQDEEVMGFYAGRRRRRVDPYRNPAPRPPDDPPTRVVPREKEPIEDRIADWLVANLTDVLVLSFAVVCVIIGCVIGSLVIDEARRMCVATGADRVWVERSPYECTEANHVE